MAAKGRKGRNRKQPQKEENGGGGGCSSLVPNHEEARPGDEAGDVEAKPQSGAVVVEVHNSNTRAWRNCSDISVAQVVAASWSDDSASGSKNRAAVKMALNAIDASAATAAASPPPVVETVDDVAVVDCRVGNEGVRFVEGLTNSKSSPFLSSDGSIAIHAGGKIRTRLQLSIPLPIFVKRTSELIDFKEGEP